MSKNKKTQAQGTNYEVERIVDKKKKNKTIHYKIHWKGFPTEDDSWEPVSNLACQELIEEFEKNLSKKSSNSKQEKEEQSTTGPSALSPEKKKDTAPVSQTRSRRRGFTNVERATAPTAPISSTSNSSSVAKNTRNQKNSDVGKQESEDSEFIVEKIVTHEIRENDRSGLFELQYQIKLQGQPRTHNQWRSAKDLKKWGNLLTEYTKSHEKAMTKAEQDLKKKNEALTPKKTKNEDNQSKSSINIRNSRKRGRTDVQSSQNLSEEENKDLEPPSKRRRRRGSEVNSNEKNQIDITQDSENESLTLQKMSSTKNFAWKNFHQAFCDAYNSDPSQRLDTFWQNYLQALQK